MVNLCGIRVHCSPCKVERGEGRLARNSANIISTPTTCHLFFKKKEKSVRRKLPEQINKITFTCSPAKTASRNRPLPSCSEYICTPRLALIPNPTARVGIRVRRRTKKKKTKGGKKIKNGEKKNIRLAQVRKKKKGFPSLYDKGRSSGRSGGGGGSM